MPAVWPCTEAAPRRRGRRTVVKVEVGAVPPLQNVAAGHVVGDKVKDDDHVALVRLVDKQLELVGRAIQRVHGKERHGVIAGKRGEIGCVGVRARPARRTKRRRRDSSAYPQQLNSSLWLGCAS